MIIRSRYTPIPVMAALIVVLYWGRQWYVVRQFRGIHGAASTIYDASKLDPDVAEFILHAQNNAVIGHQLEDFPNLWQHAIQSVSSSTKVHRSYDFSLPMTAAQQKEKDQLMAGKEGVPCWPMLGVHVNLETNRIAWVYFYNQCL